MTRCHNFLNFLGVILLSGIITISAEISQIKLVNVIFRHGDRTPDNTRAESYPTDPYKNVDYYPEGPAQLTTTGKKRAFELGKVLRKQYNEFLGSVYTQGAVAARSTDLARSKMSLLLVLASLFPPFGGQKWDKNLFWQPIPFNYVPIAEDKTLMPFLCPTYLAEVNKLLETPEIKEKVMVYDELMRNLTILTQKNITTLPDLLSIHATLFAETSVGLNLPKWTHDYFPEGQLTEAALLQYQLFSYNNNLKKRNAGMLLREIIENMRSAMNAQTNQRKINLYSGHDVNVHGLLCNLGFNEPYLVQFSSAILIELHTKSNNYYVKILHYLGIPPVMQTLTIPGCEQLCLFDRFVELTRDVIPTEDFPCQLDQEEDLTEETNPLMQWLRQPLQ